MTDASIPFLAPTAETIRDNALRAMKNGLMARGVATPNVNQGSDNYIIFQAVGNETEVASYNTVQAADQLMPDTATGANLRRIMAIYGLAPRPAGPSDGFGTFSTAFASAVATNQQLLDPNGNVILVETGGTYSDGDAIPLVSQLTGLATNLPGGTVLRWVSPPSGSAPTMALTANGLQDGVDAETDDAARARLLSLLSNFPGSGNDAQIAVFAEQATPVVEKAYVYDAANGPGTVHVAVVGFASSSKSRRRAVGATPLAAASSGVQTNLPAYVESVITTTTDVDSDVSFLLSMPAATTSNPPGDGSGFVDSNPFPSVTGATNKRMRVHAADLTPTSTQFSVESMVAPAVGQSICWVDRDTFALHLGEITVVGTTYASPSGGTPGRYGVTVDTPFVSQVGSIPADGDFIFPFAVNAQKYLDAVLTSYGNLGPYEKQLAAGLNSRSVRKPRFFKSGPYSLDDKFLRALEDAGSEVQAAAWGYQNGGTTTPSLPATITSAPNIFTPRQIAFYPS